MRIFESVYDKGIGRASREAPHFGIKPNEVLFIAVLNGAYTVVHNGSKRWGDII